MVEGVVLLIRLWRRGPMSVKSDYARHHAAMVAQMSSVGLITTRVGQVDFASQWHISLSGLAVVYEALGLPEVYPGIDPFSGGDGDWDDEACPETIH